MKHLLLTLCLVPVLAMAQDDPCKAPFIRYQSDLPFSITEISEEEFGSFITGGTIFYENRHIENKNDSLENWLLANEPELIQKQDSCIVFKKSGKKICRTNYDRPTDFSFNEIICDRVLIYHFGYESFYYELIDLNSGTSFSGGYPAQIDCNFFLNGWKQSLGEDGYFLKIYDADKEKTSLVFVSGAFYVSNLYYNQEKTIVLEYRGRGECRKKNYYMIQPGA